MLHDRKDPQTTKDGAAPATAPPAPGAADRPVVVLLNRGSGTVQRMGEDAAGRQIAAAFDKHGIACEIIVARGRQLGLLARARLQGGPPGAAPAALVVAGGDGSIGAAAQLLAGGDIPLGVLPLGTYNHFARDLGLPADLPGAVAVIARRVTIPVDLAEVNGRVFVNNASIGLYPDMVHDRERQRRRAGRSKWLAMMLAFLRVLRRLPVRRLTIEGDGWIKRRNAPIAFIGNNVYETDLASLGRRAALDGGELCLFLATRRGWPGLFGLLLDAALGRLDRARDFESYRLKRLVVRSRRRRIKVALDGEVVKLRSPLRFRIRPAALAVLAPARDAPR